MFKLQLVLGLLLGIQIDITRAEEQLKATATLGNATFNINIFSSSLDSQSDEIINDLPVDGNPEEGGYIEGYLLSAYHNINPLNIQSKKSIETENNIFPINDNPETIENVENDVLYGTSVQSRSAYKNGNPEEGEHKEGDLLSPSAVLGHSAYENMNSVNNQVTEMLETGKNKLPKDAHPEEGNNVEGDILVPTGGLYRTSLLRTGSLWLGGLIPYSLNGTFTKTEIRALLYAFDQYAAKTCIKFYPHTTERDFISIYRHEKDCSSYVGRMGGKQVINLGPNCFLRYGTVMHELMHVLGFLHEHSNYNRDKYIKILFKNVLPGYEKNFPKSSKRQTKNLGLPYDYGSVMHYRTDAFSKNGKPTIKALKIIPKGIKMGQREGFSQYDVAKINRRYQCDKLNFFRKIREILS